MHNYFKLENIKFKRLHFGKYMLIYSSLPMTGLAQDLAVMTKPNNVLRMRNVVMSVAKALANEMTKDIRQPQRMLFFLPNL